METTTQTTTEQTAGTVAIVVEDVLMHDSMKHFPYTASFTNDEGEEIYKTFHFRRPLRPHVMMIAKAGKDKGLDSEKEVLIQLVHPDERNELRNLFEDYILLVSAFSSEIFRTAGAGAVFRGK